MEGIALQMKHFEVGILWTNCYVIYNESKDAIVVDPGGPMSEVRDFLSAGDLKLRWILLTHGHGDHILGVSEIRALASEGVAIHSEDAACLSDAEKNLSYNIGSPIVIAQADRLLKDGDIIEVGSMKVRVLFTPGHTRGGCCFYITDGAQEVLLSGDTLFARSIGRTDFPGGNEDTLYQSLKKLAALPDSLKVYPGHGPDTSIGDERRLNPYWPR
jgi:glyoxylase-like metal-dependent hydrolase (beta-lactamase superfamily II)